VEDGGVGWGIDRDGETYSSVLDAFSSEGNDEDAVLGGDSCGGDPEVDSVTGAGTMRIPEGI
jgi:hypothetical protein